LAGHSDKDKDKEKVEKRRALGRGLASLLPGPRVLNPFAKTPEPTTGAKAPAEAGADAAVKGLSSTVAPAAEESSSAGVLTGEGRSSTVIPETGSASADRLEATVENPHPSAESGQGRSQSPRVVGHSSPVAESGTVPSSPGEQWSPPFAKDAKDGPPTVIANGSVDYDPYEDAPRDGVIEIQAAADTRIPTNLVVNLGIADVDRNPFQTRYVQDDEALEELAESIKANGVVQPIVVRPAEEEGRYVLILGERRLHASKKIGKTHIPALVRRVSEKQAAEMTVVENLQREDLSPLEQAEAFRVLSRKFSMTQEEIAARVGLSRASIANYMRLLKLPQEVMQLLAEKRISFGQAKELLKLGDNDRIAEAALYAVKKGMNIEQIETLVLRMDGLLEPLPGMPGAQKEKKSSGARWVDPNVRAAQIDMERMLGVRVRIRDRNGKGKIVIEYSTVDDYERVVEMLRGKK